MSFQLELEYHLLLARDLQILSGSSWQGLTETVSEIEQMLASLMQKVKGAKTVIPAEKPHIKKLKTEN